MKSKYGLLIFSLIFGTCLSAQALKPEQLSIPKLNERGFVIDPENGIENIWLENIYSSRITYYYPCYLEPVVVRLSSIKSPSDINNYADRLIKLWDLEKRSKGHYVFQLAVIEQKDIVYRFGSKVKAFYHKDSLAKIREDIIDVHMYKGENGTGSFVSISKLGEIVYNQIDFDDRRHGQSTSQNELNNIKLVDNDTSVSKNESNTSSLPTPSNSIGSENYFSGFSKNEIDKTYSGIINSTTTDIKSVENIRTVNNTNVSDPDQLLNQFAVDTINKIIDDLEIKTGYQTAVVCLNSIGSNNPRDFGTELFNYWGIGDKDLDNGLLILLVNDVHRIEFITGRGTEIVLTDALCYDIQQQEMIPNFKKNDYSTGMIRGMQALYDALTGSIPDYHPATTSLNNYDSEPNNYNYQPMPWYKSSFFFVYSALTGFLSGIYLICLIITQFIKDLQKRYYILKIWTLLVFPILFPIPFLPLLFLNKTLMERWRNTIRISLKNGMLMHKLGENEEDSFLAKGQLTEELVKSIDYDVWTTDDHSDTLILAYKKWFSKYRKCSSCKAKTYFKVYDKTIVSPTYSSTGTGEKLHRCENCGVKHLQKYTIAKLQRSSNSGRSSGGGYSGGSSYSSGSSYGGGSSRGGGSGSSW